MKKRDGQLLVEFIVVSVGLASGLFAFIMTSELATLKDKALEAASVGARLQAEGLEDAEFLNGVLMEILPKRFFSGSVIWSISHSRYLDSPAARFYNLKQTRIQGKISLARPALQSSDLFSIDEKVVMYESKEETP